MRQQTADGDCQRPDRDRHLAGDPWMMGFFFFALSNTDTPPRRTKSCTRYLYVRLVRIQHVTKSLKRPQNTAESFKLNLLFSFLRLQRC